MPNYPDFLKNTGYGDVAGILGVHCRHTFSAWFEEYQDPPYTEQQLQEQAERDKATKRYKWRDSRGVAHERDFTYRQALDRQRELERQMRQSRATLMAYKAAGQQEAYEELLVRYKAQSKEYTNFSREMKIDEQRVRITMDGLGRMYNWKPTWNI